MEGKASEKLEQVGQEYLNNLTSEQANNSNKLNKFLVVYSTMGGTSKKFAEQIVKDAKDKCDITADIKNAEEIKTIKEFNENDLIVFVLTTYYDGEPSDDCVELTNLIKKKETWDEFTNKDKLNIAIFGNGNRNFTNFNAQAILFEKILNKNQGIKSIVEVGMGDEDKDLKKTFQEWEDKLLESIKNLF